MKKYLLRPLVAMLLLTLISCATRPAIDSCPPPVWPDVCTVNWLANTPHPPCVTAWKDLYDRQQNMLQNRAP